MAEETERGRSLRGLLAWPKMVMCKRHTRPVGALQQESDTVSLPFYKDAACEEWIGSRKERPWREWL